MKSIRIKRKRAAALFCACLLLFCGCRGQTPDPEQSAPGSGSVSAEEPVTPDRSLQRGVSFSVSDAVQRGLSPDTTASLLGMMQVQTVQVEVFFRELLDLSGAIREDVAQTYQTWFAAIREYGVTDILLTVTGGCWGNGYDVADPTA